MSETYTYKVALFENGKPEEFLLIIRELNNNLEVIGENMQVEKSNTYLHIYN